VLVIEEGFPFDKQEHIKWLYTAATRAAKKLVIIRKV
jgi:ATP-dependent exoDNAse (exonuclease V) beta subunit